MEGYMNNSINPIYNNSFYVLSNTKKSEKASNPVQSVISPKVSFKGTEALAAYNYALVNKNELFNLPVIKPLDIPTKIEDIKGEKIYNSDGKIVRIISDDNKKQTTYYFRDNKLHYSLTKEKDSDIKWTMWFDGQSMGAIKILPDGTEYSTYYENNKPVQICKIKQFSEGNELQLEYLPKDKIYNVSKWYKENGKNYSSFAEFDENKKCISAHETENLFDETTDLNLKDGEPYSITTEKSKIIASNVGKSDIDLKNLEPSPFYNIDMDKINLIEGERRYYSNGKLEKILSENGDIYTFEPEGTLASIKNKTREIEFIYNYKDGIIHGQHIEEKMPDGGIKTTQYMSNSKEGFDVWYENNGIEKNVVYNSKGNIVSYSNRQEGKKEISREYDDNGNLLRCWDK